MIDPCPPHEIVLGIDMSRAWHLTVNPNNDRLVCIAPQNSTSLKHNDKAWWDERVEEITPEREKGNTVDTRALRE